MRVVAYDEQLNILNDMPAPDHDTARKLGGMMHATDPNVVRVVVYGDGDVDGYVSSSSWGDEFSKDRRFYLQDRLDTLWRSASELAIEFHRNHDDGFGSVLNAVTHKLIALSAQIKEAQGDALTEDDRYWLDK